MKLDKREIKRILFELASAVLLFYLGVFMDKHSQNATSKLNSIRVDTIYSHNEMALMDSLKKYKYKANLAEYNGHKAEFFQTCHILDVIKEEYGEKSEQYKNEKKNLMDMVSKHFSKWVVTRNDGNKKVSGIYFPDGEFAVLPE